MKLQVKFRDDASPRERDEVIDLAYKSGASDVHPLFARESKPELASVYVVEVKGSAKGQRLMRHLNKHDVVEFAEPEVRRTLA